MRFEKHEEKYKVSDAELHSARLIWSTEYVFRVTFLYTKSIACMPSIEIVERREKTVINDSIGPNAIAVCIYTFININFIYQKKCQYNNSIASNAENWFNFLSIFIKTLINHLETPEECHMASASTATETKKKTLIAFPMM